MYTDSNFSDKSLFVGRNNGSIGIELLYVKHGYSSLSLFSRDELMYAISYLSTV